MTTAGQASKNNMAPWPEGALVRHPLPAIDSSTLFCSNFLCTPISTSSIFYFFREIFALFLAFFLLNVKFLQTVLTVYRSALVISADVCCRCWNCQQRGRERGGRGMESQVWVQLWHILSQGVNKKFRWRCIFAKERRKLPQRRVKFFGHFMCFWRQKKRRRKKSNYISQPGTYGVLIGEQSNWIAKWQNQIMFYFRFSIWNLITYRCDFHFQLASAVKHGSSARERWKSMRIRIGNQIDDV